MASKRKALLEFLKDGSVTLDQYRFGVTGGTLRTIEDAKRAGLIRVTRDTTARYPMTVIELTEAGRNQLESKTEA